MAEQPALSEVVASIRHNLTCTFCHELLQDPRILPCLHTFCMQCIENLVRSRATATSEVSCPTCSQQVALESRAAARALPANSLLVSLLDVLSIQQGERIGCDVCDAATADADESVATVRCKECAQFMCELHAKGHKRAKDTKMHTLFSPGTRPTACKRGIYIVWRAEAECHLGIVTSWRAWIAQSFFVIPNWRQLNSEVKY